jgi:hypothetical protein
VSENEFLFSKEDKEEKEENKLAIDKWTAWERKQNI